VNTSFNVAGPIAQSPVQAIETLRRANGMDGVFMFSAEGPAVVVWAKEPRTGSGGRIEKWLADWQLEIGASAEA
jgi:carbamoyltransferase